MVLIWHSWQTCGFKIIWSQDLVKQLWPPDGCRMTVNAFYSTRKKLEVDWSKWMMMKRERWTSRESLWLPAISTWGYPSGLTDVREHWVWCFLSVWHQGLIPIYQKNSYSIILRPKKPWGSWNLVNPLLSMNEVRMDECAARLQPLVDQHKA